MLTAPNNESLISPSNQAQINEVMTVVGEVLGMDQSHLSELVSEAVATSRFSEMRNASFLAVIARPGGAIQAIPVDYWTNLQVIPVKGIGITVSKGHESEAYAKLIKSCKELQASVQEAIKFDLELQDRIAEEAHKIPHVLNRLDSRLRLDINEESPKYVCAEFDIRLGLFDAIKGFKFERELISEMTAISFAPSYNNANFLGWWNAVNPLSALHYFKESEKGSVRYQVHQSLIEHVLNELQAVPLQMELVELYAQGEIEDLPRFFPTADDYDIEHKIIKVSKELLKLRDYCEKHKEDKK